MASTRKVDRMTPLRVLALMLVSVGAPSGCSGSSSTPAGGNGGGNPTIITLPTQLPDEISYSQAMVLFGYDHSRPYDVQERSVTIQSGALVHDISYLGVAGKRSQAYLVMPYGKGPFGAVMYCTARSAAHPSSWPRPATWRAAAWRPSLSRSRNRTRSQ
jgi:hypothetical protein